MPKKEKVKQSVTYLCEGCGKKEMTHEVFIKHLTDTHKMNVKGLQVQKQMMLHIHMTDCHLYTYKLSFKDFTVFQYITNPKNRF